MLRPAPPRPLREMVALASAPRLRARARPLCAPSGRRRGPRACAGPQRDLEDVASRRAVMLHDHRACQTEYAAAWAWQRGACEAIAGLVFDERASGASRDQLALVQHPPTYTLGTGSTLDHVRFDVSNPPHGASVFRVERGGEVTYHGPGQLVLYPVLDLRHYRQDLHWYMRSLEEVVILALREGFGLDAVGRLDGHTGVWVGDAKVAACGVRVKRWVSFHGVALNVCPDLEHFGDIVPCGIGDRPVTSLRALLADRGAAPLDDAELLAAAAEAMLCAFEAVFGVELAAAGEAAAGAFEAADGAELVAANQGRLVL